MSKIKVDNRILKCLFCVTGDEERQLNTAFIECKKGYGLVYWATNGVILIEILEAEPELYDGDDCIIHIPDDLKGIVKWKKDDNNALYCSVIELTEEDRVIMEMFNDTPLKLEFQNIDKVIDYKSVLECKQDKTNELSIDLSLTSKVASALSKLGVRAAPTFGLQGKDGALLGFIQSQDFHVRIAIMPCRSANEIISEEKSC